MYRDRDPAYLAACEALVLALQEFDSVVTLRLWMVINIFNWLRLADPQRPFFCQGQHYWEYGRPGFRRKDVERRLNKNFNILNSYRNKDWLFRYNFVLAAKTQHNR